MGFAEEFLKGHEIGTRITSAKHAMTQQDEELKLRKQQLQQQMKIADAEQLLKQEEYKRRGSELLMGAYQQSGQGGEVPIEGQNIHVPGAAEVKQRGAIDLSGAPDAATTLGVTDTSKPVLPDVLGVLEKAATIKSAQTMGQAHIASAEKIASGHNAATLEAARIGADSREATAATTAGAKTDRNTIRLMSNFSRDTKDFGDFMSSAKQIGQLATQGTPASDTALLQQFFRLQDHSVTKEGEVKSFMANSGLPARLHQWGAELAGNGQLSPKTRMEIIGAVNGMKTAGLESFKNVQDYYNSMAKATGVGEERMRTLTGYDPTAGGTTGAAGGKSATSPKFARNKAGVIIRSDDGGQTWAPVQ